MSISVQCPNPDCEVTHKVKNKYSGMLCKCPACGSAMLVPKKKPAGSDSAPPGGMRGFASSEPSKPTPAPAAAEEDDLAAFMAAVEEEETAPAAVEDEEAVAVAEEEEAVVAVEEDEEAVVAEAEEEVAVAEEDEDFFAAEEALEDEEPAPKKGKGKAVVEDEDEFAAGLFAEEDEEPAPKKGKGKKDDKKKGKNPFDDEDILADEDVLADEEVEAAIEEEEEEPAPKKGKGKKEEPKKKGKNVFEDEDVLADEIIEEEEEPAPKKGKKDGKKKGGRMLDEDADAELSEDEEDGEGRPAGGLSKTVVTVMLLGIVGAGTALASLFMDLFSVSSAIPVTAEAKEILNLPDDVKNVFMGGTGAATALSLLGLLLAWRGRGYGVFSLLLTYLGWLVIAAFAIFMTGMFVTLNDKIKEVQAPVSAGPGLLLGAGGGLAAAILIPVALYLVHRRTWARMILILLFGGAIGLGVWFTHELKADLAKRSHTSPPSKSR